MDQNHSTVGWALSWCSAMIGSFRGEGGVLHQVLSKISSVAMETIGGHFMGEKGHGNMSWFLWESRWATLFLTAATTLASV